jgi:ribosome-associated protein
MHDEVTSLMQAKKMQQEIHRALVDAKGQDIQVLDVRKITDFTDYMIIASGTSSRHVQTLADKICVHMKALGRMPVGREGQAVGDWVLVDFGDVVAHLMRPPIRDLYNLEKLWSDGQHVEHTHTGVRR